MSGVTVGILSLVVMLVLIYAGMHIPVVLAVVSFLGVWAMREDAALAAQLLGLATANSLASYLFGVVPLFVLMGLLVAVSDIGRDTFDIADRLLGRLRGGLGVATVAANAVFAAVTGISIASAAVFTKVAVPEMLRYGYAPRLAVGVVAGSSVLGMLIPPSLLLIVFGLLSEKSIGDLFIAGIIPGIVLAVAFGIGIVIIGHRAPHLVGADHRREPPPLAARDWILKPLPVVVLVSLVMGGIYGGVFTPTEAGAAGALGALVIALVKGRLSLRTLWQLLVETGHITASISLLVLAATMYSRMLALSGLPTAFGHWIVAEGFGLYGLLAIYIVAVIMLGTVLDSISIMLLLLPLVLPVVSDMGANLFWFGIITVIAVEIGLLTPPFGLSVFTIKATLHDETISLNDIFAGAFPFACIMLAVLVLIIAVPWLATALVHS